MISTYSKWPYSERPHKCKGVCKGVCAHLCMCAYGFVFFFFFEQTSKQPARSVLVYVSVVRILVSQSN